MLFDQCKLLFLKNQYHIERCSKLFHNYKNIWDQLNFHNMHLSQMNNQVDSHNQLYHSKNHQRYTNPYLQEQRKLTHQILFELLKLFLSSINHTLLLFPNEILLLIPNHPNFTIAFQLLKDNQRNFLSMQLHKEQLKFLMQQFCLDVTFQHLKQSMNKHYHLQNLDLRMYYKVHYQNLKYGMFSVMLLRQLNQKVDSQEVEHRQKFPMIKVRCMYQILFFLLLTFRLEVQSLGQKFLCIVCMIFLWLHIQCFYQLHIQHIYEDLKKQFHLFDRLQELQNQNNQMVNIFWIIELLVIYFDRNQLQLAQLLIQNLNERLQYQLLHLLLLLLCQNLWSSRHNQKLSSVVMLSYTLIDFISRCQFWTIIRVQLIKDAVISFRIYINLRNQKKSKQKDFHKLIFVKTIIGIKKFKVMILFVIQPSQQCFTLLNL